MRPLFYRTLGLIFVVLGIIGVFLPVFPTTPFILLAAACFSRSSERWHQYLLNNAYFGSMIKRWEEQRCISCRAKLTAMLSIIIFGGGSLIFLINNSQLRIVSMILLLVGLIVVGSVKVCEKA